MKAIIIGTVEDVQSYEGKNGFGANIKVSQMEDKRREFLEFNTSDHITATHFEEALQQEVTMEINLQQNRFGLRLGEVLSMTVSE
ncbi:hypothetical protein [Clostridium sp.]|jgi:exosome complex RNA-binding protein Csl4|uniref:hypothetical protein n=1 Tax=Clostridium sp. TaxID=1506 RepID=UPI0029143AA6|nr:hypothetical protein [Clostridium sp.]MDU7215837.1 hypothetical protein [Clostridium sp.]MDU7238123.1 hypothetical protein [Clostridium perfringens]